MRLVKMFLTPDCEHFWVTEFVEEAKLRGERIKADGSIGFQRKAKQSGRKCSPQKVHNAFSAEL